MAEGRIRVRRRSHFVAVPHGIARDPSLSDKAIRLWVLLGSYADFDDLTCYPSVPTLAKEMGCHAGTIRRTVAELTRRGFLTVELRGNLGRPNLYTLLTGAEADLPDGGEARTGATPTPRTGARPGRASVRGGGRARVRAKREPVEREPENETPRADARPLFEPEDALHGFAQFWAAYPARNGKKLDRGKAEAAWTKLNLEQRRAAWRGACNLAAAVSSGYTLPKDAHRFLAGHCWADWQEPATGDTRRARDPRRRDDGTEDETLLAPAMRAHARDLAEAAENGRRP